MSINILLAGNPNVGKTTVFNRLTKSFEHVGNWHGVTVDKTSKKITYDGQSVQITDLPGIYSLTSYSGEEEISRDAIYSRPDDVIINVCDAGNLARNLYLTLQLLERGARVVLAVNMVNELDARGIAVNFDKLAATLDVTVVPIDLKFDPDALLGAALSESVKPKKTRKTGYYNGIPITKAKSIIGGGADDYAAVKALEGDDYIISRLGLSDKQKEELARGDMRGKIAAARYAYIDKLLGGVIEVKSGRAGRPYGKLDRVLLNRRLALPIFALIMLTVFLITFGQFTVGGKTFGLLGYVLKQGLSLFFENCVLTPVSSLLAGSGAAPWVVGLLSEGVLGGLLSVLVFLPQIVLLFFFLALLEDSGYISRVAFMTDGLFQKIGLSGRSVFTMLMGFGCSATAVLTARGLEDEVMRKKTVLLTPFMSCSARLPVFLAICSAYFASGQIFVIMGMYLLGIAVSIIYAAAAEKTKKLRSGRLSFLMELPPYRFPTAARTVQLLWHNAKAFIVRVGTVVFLLNVAVWLLSHFTPGFAYTGSGIDGSLLWFAAKAVSPLFAPLGFGNANAVISLVSGVIAKEAVISTMDALGGAGAVFAGEFASAAALSFLVFTLLYIPCVATLAAISKELGAKWMLAGMLMQLVTAYAAALAFYWIGVLFISHTGIAVSIIIIIAVGIAAAIAAVKLFGSKKGCGKCGNCTACKK